MNTVLPVDLIPFFTDPPESDWPSLLARPMAEKDSHTKTVAGILAKVKEGGDESLRSFTKEFDGVELATFKVPQAMIDNAADLLDDELKNAIITAAQNIRHFHESQIHSEPAVSTMPGVKCWRKPKPIGKIGLYIPGGSAPLFSTVLMLGIPASLAGCSTIVLCTPPAKDGSVHPAILFAARQAGISNIFRVGGAHAIAAMAYGTESIPAVYKIFGPGNQFVNTAKQLVQLDDVVIDMPAGPSEVCVIADDTANASYVAADLLSQAEHGPDSQVVLITTSIEFARDVQSEVTLQLQQLDRKDIAALALASGRIVVVKDILTAARIADTYAAEHLIISCRGEEEIAAQINNAGSIFIGPFSPESAGDYASGTNHTLPTNGMARAYSGVSVDSFVKKITYQQLTREGLAALAPAITSMAKAEGLDGHANAVNIRLKSFKENKEQP